MKINTVAIHGAHVEKHNNAGKPVITPIYQTSTFCLGEHEYANIQNKNMRAIDFYTRCGNPTLRHSAKLFADLHGAECGEIFASGLGAVSASLLTFLAAGDSIVTGLDIYGGSVVLINKELTRLGIEVINVNFEDIAAVRKAIKPNTKVLYYETITNPLLKVPNVPAIAKISKELGIKFILDNTFATAYNFLPLQHGVDLVLESSTKYLSGHSDCIGGYVAGSNELMSKVWQTSISFGASADPFAAFLVERGMKTLPLRMEQHNKNAQKVANFLVTHPAIEKVYYPGLATHASHTLAKTLLKGFGGMISMVLKGGNAAGLKFMQQLKLPAQAVSLGGVESLISMPFNTSHSSLTDEQRAQVEIVPGFVRLSVGIEDAEDLIQDLKQSLDAICR
ncbi:MAG: aminotransferase class I/II-fold pyridoxal phosphate-dependent enzyme [Gammaproteobacteria bacterium]|nr:aminotransferase class I/II-fold pyridoxal phosphate-dependent enzyme [Gammaproteobacteria bacterium]